ncbi:MAG: hypothetical protein A3H72_02385 [Candidatus Doudnabacteria bacterium RIFCSPLOWO2_02_FULL_48_8]|uniref:Uncharacterized protein n=1 Tax=Candidatus Doudnabacteria bacterium RIFCSPHIGHO2_01_FULL_46_24 TaxID=1817825 RepID=A0A1F5NT96_9BACT|nr:MAG: hypothetical protein A2720_04345 [Candidatus Doudnabacteria bacterium RIFCSPHIGHO2_01_FULL_46_24]OGE94122.1 MAG: hypothetical protein A3E98_02605 [Candidatus Doudnabacteria bacterium RIFCSPHIGHO2_12_FULL_48_11]OGE95735.1 MAG: hypothetical protein A3H72_02385 [Candidatus Doudnabacteria bacterium RIFCSPLOWO2_02_FULL_48_8]
MSEPITKQELVKTLGEFTEETLLPALSAMMDEKFKNFSLKRDLKQVISETDAKQILSLEPFPKS